MRLQRHGARDGSDPTVPPSTPGLDGAHSAPGSACLQCHRLLDPTRSILSATYSWNYHTQVDPTLTSRPGLFAFEGVVTPVTSVATFGATLAAHPLLASGWVEKLCYYANSEACQTTDPEFQRIVDALSKVSNKTTVPLIVSGLPSDGYGRGAVAPVLPNQPTLFYRAGTENICEAVAGMVIDAQSPAPGVKQWSSTQPTAAISDFVQTVMALTPSDPRSAAALTLLQAHFTAATRTGASASSALKSTFVAACLAPSSVTIGL